MTAILLDCDGVLANFEQCFLHILNAQTGRKHTTEEITDFDFRKCLCTAAEAKDVWDYISATPGIVESLSDYRANVRAAKRLMHEHRVVCVTSPRWYCRNWMYERTKWLMRMGFKHTDIVFTSDKSIVQGDMLIDDNYTNVFEWQSKHPLGRGILLSRPWNAAFEWADRIESLADVL